MLPIDFLFLQQYYTVYSFSWWSAISPGLFVLYCSIIMHLFLNERPLDLQFNKFPAELFYLLLHRHQELGDKTENRIEYNTLLSEKHCIKRVYDRIIDFSDIGNAVDLSYLELSKVFDNVPDGKLVKMEKMGINTVTTRWQRKTTVGYTEREVRFKRDYRWNFSGICTHILFNPWFGGKN